ncbi:hypothetical protein QBC46DRAFT_9691 [Diplogelasinospora grovesii]|uniref:Uncharacterized protein n=1 Tax=Diplogelasinospora grovesii TaxID=303347 RepID=A0AAN6N1Q2_9PEZI|nr:hypothetical protein QBC46DRAFT_9691 [Diplogelasinospora grovesii]
MPGLLHDGLSGLQRLDMAWCRLFLLWSSVFGLYGDWLCLARYFIPVRQGWRYVSSLCWSRKTCACFLSEVSIVRTINVCLVSVLRPSVITSDINKENVSLI